MTTVWAANVPILMQMSDELAQSSQKKFDPLVYKQPDFKECSRQSTLPASQSPYPAFEARFCIRMEVAVCVQSQHHVKSQIEKSNHLHADTARKFRLDRHLDSLLIQGFEDLEDGHHFGHHRPYGRVSKASPNTDPSTKSKCDVFHVVGFKGTVVVKKSLWYERL